jgi:hypothetical protein
VRDAGGADVASDEVVVLPSGGAPSPLLTRPSPARSRCGGGPTQFWGSGLVGLVEPVAFFTFYLRSTPSARPRSAPSVAGSALLTAGSRHPVTGSTLPTTGPGPPVAGSVPLAWPLRRRSSSLPVSGQWLWWCVPWGRFLGVLGKADARSRADGSDTLKRRLPC